MKKAFTLIELLVVIVIIAILAAILFPVFNRVRERGRQTSCQSNLKQIAAALAIYRDDNGGYAPHSVYLTNAGGVIEKHCYWPSALFPASISNKVLKCPSDGSKGNLSYANNRFLFGFAECNWTYAAPQSSAPSVKNIVLPHKVITFTEVDGSDPSDPVPFGGIDDIISRRSGWFGYLPSAKTADRRHNGGSNYVFWDSHVESLRPEQIGRDSAGGGGSAIAQSTPSLFEQGGGGGCISTKQWVKDTEPWWGPGIVQALSISGNTYGAPDGFTDIINGTITGIWGFCQHSFEFGIDEAGRNDLYNHGADWHWGDNSDDPGPYVNGGWWFCVIDQTHARGRYAYGTMPTFNRAW